MLTTDKVRWWSDFNRVYYHPRSAIRFNQYQNDASSFQSFIQGRELFKDINKVSCLPGGTKSRMKIFWIETFDPSQKNATPYKDSK